MQTLRVNSYDMAYLELGQGKPSFACTARSAISAPSRRSWGRCRGSIE